MRLQNGSYSEGVVKDALSIRAFNAIKFRTWLWYGLQKWERKKEIETERNRERKREEKRREEERKKEKEEKRRNGLATGTLLPAAFWI